MYRDFGENPGFGGPRMDPSWDFQDGGSRNDDFSSKIFVDFEIRIFPEFFN